MTTYLGDPNNQAIFNAWADRFTVLLNEVRQWQPSSFANAAEAFERGETTLDSKLPLILNEKLQRVSENPTEAAQEIMALHHSALTIIVELLATHWFATGEDFPERPST